MVYVHMRHIHLPIYAVVYGQNLSHDSLNTTIHLSYKIPHHLHYLLLFDSSISSQLQCGYLETQDSLYFLHKQECLCEKEVAMLHHEKRKTQNKIILSFLDMLALSLDMDFRP